MNYDKNKIIRLLHDASIGFVQGVSLRAHSTWQIGGVADFVCFPASVVQLQQLICIAKENNAPYFVIGKGSNLLFSDDGISGIIIKLDRQFSHYTVSDNSIIAQSGIFLPYLARIACNNSLAGLNHIAGIPGNLGGLIAMNGGSLGCSIGDSIQWVKILNSAGEIIILSNAECGFSYRSSIFQLKDYIIVECKLDLALDNYDKLFAGMIDILRTRRSKYPRRMPTCGSVFKSPSEIYGQFGPPGKIIEYLGLKGLRIGDAQISPEHANFFVNLGNASAKDMVALVQKVQTAFYDKYNCILPCEFKYIDKHGIATNLILNAGMGNMYSALG